VVRRGTGIITDDWRWRSGCSSKWNGGVNNGRRKRVKSVSFGIVFSKMSVASVYLFCNINDSAITSSKACSPRSAI
jgi:hypothetical protein